MDSGYYDLCSVSKDVSNNESSSVFDDLTKLTHLTSQAALACLSDRYHVDAFYTWAGPTLVAINPLHDHPHLYSEEFAQKFCSRESTSQNEPHIFALAERARKSLSRKSGKVNQAIVVNGESGAGKTCSAKYLLSYLANIESSSLPGPRSALEANVLLSNTILEAFGNAKTLRNNNSSRFGKLLKLNFHRGLLSRAHIQTYLLERTRVSFQPAGERNFHIFYQLVTANPYPELYLGNDECLTAFDTLPGKYYPADKAAFQETSSAMEKLGFDQHQRKELWCALAGILHLGQLKFSSKEKDHWVILDSHSCSGTGSLNLVCKLLGLDQEGLVDLLTTRIITAGQSCFKKPLASEAECVARRDTLSRFIYQKLFQTIVDHVNRQLNARDSRGEFMGILDVYGFESFEFNSLEQLCINYANERLQQYFVRDFLLDQQKTLEDEGITLDCAVNDEERMLCIKALDGPFSVFGVLNEECQLKRSSDEEQICQRLQAALTQISSTTPRKREGLNFTVRHYAGNVKYSTRGLVEKNGDQVPCELLTLMCRSRHTLIATFGEEDLQLNQGNQKSGRKHTVLAKFKASMDALLRTLDECDVHYVRCVKPCEHICTYIGTSESFKRRQGLPWEDAYVEAQLQACGVMETVRFSRMGFPIRIKLEEFYHRFRILSCKINRTDSSKVAEELVECVGAEKARVGKFRVFLTEDGMEWLERKREESLASAANVIQTFYRSYQARKRYRTTKRALLVLQKLFRVLLLRKRTKYFAQEFRRKEEEKREVEAKKKAVAVVSPVVRVRETFKASEGLAKDALFGPSDGSFGYTSTEDLFNLDLCDKKQWQEWSRSLVPFLQQRKILFCENLGNENTLVLTLPKRFPVFWKNGILSVRKPPAVKVHFLPKLTCLPYSHIPPRALLSRGLLEAL